MMLFRDPAPARMEISPAPQPHSRYPPQIHFPTVRAPVHSKRSELTIRILLRVNQFSAKSVFQESSKHEVRMKEDKS